MFYAMSQFTEKCIKELFESNGFITEQYRPKLNLPDLYGPTNTIYD
jgi:hypothetical protein